MDFEDYVHSIGQAYIQYPVDSNFRDSVFGEFPTQEYRLFPRLSRDELDPPEFIGIDHAIGNDRSAVTRCAVVDDFLECKKMADQYLLDLYSIPSNMVERSQATLISTPSPTAAWTLKELEHTYKVMAGKDPTTWVSNLRPSIKKILDEVKQMIEKEELNAK